MRIPMESRIICRENTLENRQIEYSIDIFKNKILNLIRDDTPIGIFLPRNEKLLITILSLIELRIPFVPLSKAFPQDRCQFIIDECGIKNVITISEYEKNFNCINSICLDKEYGNDEVEKRYIERSDFSNLLYIIYTSGSSGSPKGVKVKRDAFFKLLLNTDCLGFKLGKSIFGCADYSFDIFYFETIIPLYKGMTVYLADEDEISNPKHLRQLITRYKLDYLQITPSRLIQIYFMDVQMTFLKNVKTLLIGGEKLDKKLFDILKNNTQCKIYNLYGPTEATIWTTVGELTRDENVHVGYAFPEAKVFIDTSTNEIGEIIISGAYLAEGYVNNIEAEKKAFFYIENDIRAYRTGDLGRINEKGELEVLGRIDNQVKYHGFRIELEEIESIIMEVDGIILCGVCMVGEETQSRICAFYTGRKLKSDEIKEYIKRKLPIYMVPESIRHVESLPTSINGKLDRGKLSKIALQENNFDITQEIEKIIRNMVELNQISEEMSLKDLDSLAHIKLLVELEDNFKITFDDKYLIKGAFGDIAELGDYIKNKQKF